MKTYNLFGEEWDREETRPGWASKDGWVAERLGAELLGGSVYELAAGQRLFPYHFHHANEEWVIVLAGTPTLRSPDGEQVLHPGDVAVFLRGEGGAHQLRNDSDGPVRVLMMSSMLTPDIVEYPDSGKVSASVNHRSLFLTRPGEPLDYWDGED